LRIKSKRTLTSGLLYYHDTILLEKGLDFSCVERGKFFFVTFIVANSQPKITIVAKLIDKQITK